MTNSKTISLRIPSELLSKIDRLAEEKHSSHKGVPNRSLAILDAVTHYFEAVSCSKGRDDNAAQDTVSIDKFQALEKIVYSLSDEIALLKNKLNTLHDNVLTNKMSSFAPDQVSSQANEPQQLSIETEIYQQVSIPSIPRKIFVKRLKGFSQYKEATALSKLSQQKKILGGESFSDWSQRQDIDGIRWREETIPKSNAKQYLPDGSLSDELRCRLLKWIKENSNTKG